MQKRLIGRLAEAMFGIWADSSPASQKKIRTQLSRAFSEKNESNRLALLEKLWPNLPPEALMAHFAGLRAVAGKLSEADRVAREVGRPAAETASLRRSLADLKMRSLYEYSVSRYWAGLRIRLLAGSPDCDFCGMTATRLFLSSYAPRVMRGDTVIGVHVCCQKCHRELEARAEKTANG